MQASSLLSGFFVAEEGEIVARKDKFNEKFSRLEMIEPGKYVELKKSHLIETESSLVEIIIVESKVN